MYMDTHSGLVPAGHIPDDPDAAELRSELQKLCDEAAKRGRNADHRVSFWAITDVALGFPAALLAGASGAAGLATADARVPAALLALVAAGLSAGAGFLRSDVRRENNKRSRRNWAAVEAEARIALATATRLSAPERREALRRVYDLRITAVSGQGAELP